MGTQAPRVLIACPTFDGKAYAFPLWLDAVRQFPCETLVVDNSETLDFFYQWKYQVPLLHLDVGDEPPNRRIALSMEHIRQYFLAGEWDWWWDIESDVIPSFYLWDFVQPYLARDYLWMTVPYPKRDEMLERSFGCTFFSRRVLKQIDFGEAPSEQTTDGWFVAHVGTPHVLRTALTPQHLERVT